MYLPSRYTTIIITLVKRDQPKFKKSSAKTHPSNFETEDHENRKSKNNRFLKKNYILTKPVQKTVANTTAEIS